MKRNYLDSQELEDKCSDYYLMGCYGQKFDADINDPNLLIWVQSFVAGVRESDESNSY